jgi:L-asparaginase II
MTHENPVLADVVRSGFAESRHRGSIVVVDPDGAIARARRRARAMAPSMDGCGAPLFAISLTGLARAFGALVLAGPGSAERRVADAMRANPKWTSGSHRPDREVVEAVPGLLLKSGAEGVQAFALADGRAAAFKIDDGDGSRRARIAVMVALLAELGADVTAVAGLASPPVYGGGRVVGEVRISLPF